MELSILNSALIEPLIQSTQSQQLEGLQRGLEKGQQASQQGDDTLKKAATEFEAFFLYYLLKTMRESVPKGGLFSGGRGEEIFTSIYDDVVARNMAIQGGIGLTELIQKIP